MDEKKKKKQTSFNANGTWQLQFQNICHRIKRCAISGQRSSNTVVLFHKTIIQTIFISLFGIELIPLPPFYMFPEELKSLSNSSK